MVELNLEIEILQHSQQDRKNLVAQRRINIFRQEKSQETRFLALVQDS
jgi:hypothetical protein